MSVADQAGLRPINSRPEPSEQPSGARGRVRTWIAPAHAQTLRATSFEQVMRLSSSDRHHAKQGRSTARVRLPSPEGGAGVTVYLKRHFQLGWWAGLKAFFRLPGAHSPAAREFANLRAAEALGVRVPAAVAMGERLGPGLRLQSFLMVEELVGLDELHRVIPRKAEVREPLDFEGWKRAVVRRLAHATARLHSENWFHKDLYLCHFFLTTDVARDGVEGLTLIDLHRMTRHRWTRFYWLVKDLGQLLFSTFGVTGLTDRDRLRFWAIYRRLTDQPKRGLLPLLVRGKAARYQRHESRRRGRRT